MQQVSDALDTPMCVRADAWSVTGSDGPVVVEVDDEVSSVKKKLAEAQALQLFTQLELERYGLCGDSLKVEVVFRAHRVWCHKCTHVQAKAAELEAELQT
eukprot:3413639-Amphidinium_carterae.2